ncbi:2-oxoglutarate-dependent dioxygenase htyE-like [Strongylocentrotus purpuratus]|uniref:Fe2OG dioxygenase domain-containing protein n=1 Tax=Strongylocentrotus purpuratus TaxID=7668 RepID=A0A7M7P6A0_STRPU|nr:2-oxoglutarate-dependent dioxygenase htyE-like [Strongylocentrotus purpuratus]
MPAIMVDAVPIIDFSAYSLDRESPDPEGFQKLIDDVHQALTTIGFMYLKNFGIPAQKINDAFAYSKMFFSLPLDEKMTCVGEHCFHGYYQMEKEGLNPDRPYKDLKECFNYCPFSDSPQMYPEKSLPEFQKCMSGLFNAAIPLHNRVLEIMARGLNLENPFYFVERHRWVGTKQSQTTLRTLYYPSLADVKIKEDQVRCGEHCDYGGITLLFQDKQPGLEVENVHGKWIPAPPIEGTVVVNIGEIMQMWTSDKLIACKHRVMVPADHIDLDRQSIAFFGNPDNDAVLECIDQSNKYPPTTIIDLLNMKYEQTTTKKLNSRTY